MIEALRQLVSDRDTLKKNTKLYALWNVATPLAEKATPHFASAIDQGTDFVVEIQTTEAMTEAEIKKAFNLKNMNAPEEKKAIHR